MRQEDPLPKILTRFWPELPILCHVGFLTGRLTQGSQPALEQMTMRMQKKGHTALYDQVSSHHHLGLILFTRTKSLSSATTSGKRITAGGQREEFRPWQRSWGRRLGIRKGVIKPQETPCSQASTPKPESVLCSHLHLWLYGGLSPRTVSLGEGVNVQLQGNKNSWAWQECFSLRTPLKVI